MKWFRWIGIIFLLGCSSIFAGNSNETENKTIGVISGRVTEENSGAPLAYANVAVAGTILGAVSDAEGFFKIIKVPQGIYTIVATYIGYEKKALDNVKVKTGETTHIEVRLAVSEITSEEIVVSATRKETTANLAPASVGVITAEEMQKKNISTFDQAIESAPSVQLTRSSGSNVQAVSIRGSSEVAGAGVGNRVLLLIDGRPALSPESGGALWNLVPTNSIERIEVVKGAYSSLYGSSAMGGVINVITKNPSPVAVTRIHTEYGFYEKAPGWTGYDTYNAFNTIEVAHSRRVGNVSYLIEAGHRHNDGHRQNTEFDMVNLYGKTAYHFANNKNLQLAMNYNHVANDYPATWLSFLQPYHVAPAKLDNRQQRSEFSTDLYYYSIPTSELKYSSRFYYYTNNSEYTFWKDSSRMGNERIRQTSINNHRIGNVTQFDYYMSERHYMISGMEIQLDFVDARPANILYGKHTAYNVAAYSQDEIKLSDRLTTTFGLRYDYNKIVDGYGEGNFSPKISTVYEIQKDWSVRALVAQAFRNPSIAERYIKYEQGGNLHFHQNPNLKSEKLYASFEVGTKFKITDYTSYDISLFWNEYKNMIAYIADTAVAYQGYYKVVNLNRARMRGVEASIHVFYKQYLNASAGYTLLDARDISKDAGTRDVGYTSGNHDLPYKAKHSFNFNIDAGYEPVSLNLNGRYNSAIREVSIYPGSEPDAFFVLNGKFSVEFLPKRSVYISAQNITNTQYEEIERYRMPGRSYMIGCSMQF
ncbi:MAG TPA: TonB-dependent receptor [bacterium]|nr:TonB-dependent receptor [bacterium]HMZ03073.1 TonB-dependent receptor [bacterium]HNB56722.1 TonB-dependent receptor [bacterium]HNC48363.1 TonB-dependent receptor [bacterium]HND76943.1 TonB-dependent receptor [bacterium]